MDWKIEGEWLECFKVGKFKGFESLEELIRRGGLEDYKNLSVVLDWNIGI
ncbi:hypothetical protein MM236_15820 [Belliella sp. DSM 107340]|uniref:Riboflavin kinase n=1 Tax=Belliella calami TaxID=2923436 RepID=A0ABS9US71_9BACT|nr:hypothetical protein [Belliella calami]MCH7399471.1 hypothetical protein [Belliella calami]